MGYLRREYKQQNDIRGLSETMGNKSLVIRFTVKVANCGGILGEVQGKLLASFEAS